MIASHKIAWWRLCKRISVKNKTKQNKNPTKLQTCWQRIEFLLLMFNRRLHWEIFYVSKKLFIKYPFSEFKNIWSQPFIPEHQDCIFFFFLIAQRTPGSDTSELLGGWQRMHDKWKPTEIIRIIQVMPSRELNNEHWSQWGWPQTK